MCVCVLSCVCSSQVEMTKYTFSHGMNFANHMFPYGISDSAWLQMKVRCSPVCFTCCIFPCHGHLDAEAEDCVPYGPHPPYCLILLLYMKACGVGLACHAGSVHPSSRGRGRGLLHPAHQRVLGQHSSVRVHGVCGVRPGAATCACMEETAHLNKRRTM